MFNHHFLSLTFIFAYLITRQFSIPSDSPQSPFCSSFPTTTTTTTSQFAKLNTIPLSFLFTLSRSRFIPLDNMFLFFLLLLSGDIEPNPGPTSCTFNVCTLNIMSPTNRAHYTALSTIAETHHIHMFALTETWIPPLTNFS
jgi:hypothetical protein